MTDESTEVINNETSNFYYCQIKHVTINMDNKGDLVKNITLNWLPTACCFQGRQDVFVNIKQRFETNRLVVLYGMPGIGKTETARHFGNRNREHYNGNLVWIYAETPESIQMCFDDLAQTLNLKLTDTSQIFNKFKSSKSLFVFDNVENMTTVKTYLPSSVIHPFVDVLITSRRSEWCSSICKAPLLSLDENDALDIFKEKLGVKYHEYEPGKWQELVQKLDGIPLCLQITSSLIQQQLSRIRLTEFKLENYIQELEESFISLTVSDFEQNYYNKSVLAAINSVLSRLEEVKALYSLDLLCFTAYLNTDRIYEEDLLLIPSVNESRALLEEGLNNLVDYSLIQVVNDPYFQKIKIRVHRTIQLVLRNFDVNQRSGYFFKTVLRMSVSDQLFFHEDSLFKHAKKKEFLKKTIEFYNEHDSLIHEYLTGLARHNCDETLQIILPEFKTKYKKTDKFNFVFIEMLFETINNNNIKPTQLLIENVAQNENYPRLFDAASCWPSVEFIDIVLESNIFRKKRSRYLNWKQTTLHFLSCSSNTENVSDENIILKNSVKEGFLYSLVWKCNKENAPESIKCIEQLTSKWNANIDFERDASDNILHIACYNAELSLELLKCLGRIAKDKLIRLVNCRNKFKRTPLHVLLICNKSNSELLESFRYLLTEFKADISIQDEDGWNILFYICLDGSLEMINFILSEANCSQIINVQDKEGDVPFSKLIDNELIEEVDKIKIFHSFFQNRLEFNLKNEKNETILQIAQRKGLTKLSEVLEKHYEELLDVPLMNCHIEKPISEK